MGSLDHLCCNRYTFHSTTLLVYSASITTMGKDNGKCGANCDCPDGTCAKENGKCGANCDCPAGTCQNENGKCGADCDCPAGTCNKE